MTTRYTKDHEWAREDGDGTVCGITDYAQKALGDVVYVELPPVGKKVKQGEPTAGAESAKAGTVVYAPVYGEVIAGNTVLSSDPGKVNASPAKEGWFFKLKAANPAQISSLMDEGVYQNHVKELLAG